MIKLRTSFLVIAVVISIFVTALGIPAEVQATTPDPLVGDWYAAWESGAGYYGYFWFSIFTMDTAYYATMYIPDLGIFYQVWPVIVNGDSISFAGFLNGMITGGMINGQEYLPVPYDPGYDLITWQGINSASLSISVGDGPGPVCTSLPPLYCRGSAEYCGELVQFDPVSTPGYIDYPVNGETWDNQYRSWIRRDLMQVISYATAKLACKTATWDFGNHAPVGLVDMSEADGSIPGTSIGQPGHPAGTHEGGQDIDLAYYQVFMPWNRVQPVCDHYDFSDGFFSDANHCTSQPYLLDAWRTALFTAFVSEHPGIRLVAMDGIIGPIITNTLDQLVGKGWVDPELRPWIPLGYEEVDLGRGLYYYHHHHLHVSMFPVQPILRSLAFKPEVVNLRTHGKYITAYIELVDGYDPGLINVQTVFINADGFSVIVADPAFSKVGDYNQNGVPDFMVKFDLESLKPQLVKGTVEITLNGSVDGAIFQGADTITVR